MAAFDVCLIQRIQNVRGRLAAVLVQQENRQPAVRGRALQRGLHHQRQSIQLGDITLKNGPFLLNAKRQYLYLPTANAGADVTHTVVVADLFMLIPGEGLPSLSSQFQSMNSICLVLADQHTAARCGDNLVAIERQCAKLAKGAALAPGVLTPQSLSRILNQGYAMFPADSRDLIQLGGITVQMDDDNSLRKPV